MTVAHRDACDRGEAAAVVAGDIGIQRGGGI